MFTLIFIFTTNHIIRQRQSADQSLLTWWWHTVINTEWVRVSLATPFQTLWWLHYKQELAYILIGLWLYLDSIYLGYFESVLLFLTISNKIASLIVAAFFIGTESKMKLWDVLATCLLLLSSVATRPLYQNTQPAKRTSFRSSYSDSASPSVEDEEPAFQREDHNLQDISMEDQCKAHGMFWKKIFCDVRSLW